MSERKLVRDLMSVGVETCSPSAAIIDVTHLILDKALEAVVVLDPEGHAVGVVGQTELTTAYVRDDRDQLTAEDIMSENIPQVPAEIPLETAAQIMHDLGTRVVFMMHHAGGITYPAAMLTYTHLLRHLAAHDEDDLTDLGTRAARKPPLEKFIEKRDAARRQSRFPYEE